MARTEIGIWQGSAGLGIPQAMRQPCRYEAYVPDPLVGRPVLMPPDVAGELASIFSAR